MKGKLSLLSAAVLLALAGSNTDAAQKPTKAAARSFAPASFKHPHGTTVLYDQTFSSGPGLLSQNFTSSGGSAYDAAGADDFVVTDATGWTVSEVDVTGVYFNGPGPADSFDVTFYNDAGGVPGTIACSSPANSYTTSGAGFQIGLGTGGDCALAAGTYWVSAKANMSFGTGGEFGWISYTGAGGASAVWESAGGLGTGCTDWTSLSGGCFSFPPGDSFSFALVGHVNGGGSGISLTVGLAEDNGDPNQCGTSTNLSATAGDRINFCYTVTNNSSTTLNYHTLTDSVDGTIFTNLNQTVAPGASFQYNRIITATASESPTSTWVAADELPGYTPTSGPFNFIDITGSGTNLSLGDDSSADVTIPFSFNFYGQTSNQVCVNNNGHVIFATSSTCSGNYFNSSLPTALFSNPAFLPFWDDLYAGGADLVATVGSSPNRQFVVEWSGKDTFSSFINSSFFPPGYTFELVLNEADNSIDFNYGDVNIGSPFGHDGGASATIGLQLNSSTANQYSFDSAVINSSTNIHWTTSSPTTFSASAQVTLDVGAPILSLSPTSLSATASSGTSTSQTLNIGNTGDRDLDWDLTEAPGSTKPASTHPSSSHFVPNYAQGPSSPKPVPADLRRPGKPGQHHAPVPFGVDAVPTFGETFSFSGTNYISLDASAPQTENVITSLSQYFFAGTFASNDFSTEYAVEYPTNDLYSIDTSTGATTLIGSTGVSGGSASGLRWDPTSGITYLMVPDASCSSSTLYTIDLGTGAVQSVGTASGVCIIDIAFDSAGNMYGVDIVADNTMSVDKTSGQAQVIGSTGFDFNYAEGMDFDPATQIMYFAGFDRGGTGLGGMYTLDLTTGAATLIAPIGPNGDEFDAMAIAVPNGPCAQPTDVPWLSENPTSGTTSPGGNDPVTVTFDATGLTAGTYDANVCVNTNDQTQRHAAVPVTFTVTGGNDEIFKDGFDGP